jgi:hypothetical protein
MRKAPALSSKSVHLVSKGAEMRRELDDRLTTGAPLSIKQ